MEKITDKDYREYSPHFINGIEFLRRGMLSQANHSFEMAYEQVTYSDKNYNKYASYCGYSRVLNGDRGGLSICREVARNELTDGDVFYNLAKSEWQFHDRKRTISVLEKGLEIDAVHLGMKKLRQSLGIRQKVLIGFLPRDNLLNKKLGKLFRR